MVQVLNISGNYVILSALSFNTTLALNTTYYGYLALTNLPANFSSYISYIVPCRLDILYMNNSQAALDVAVPFGAYVASIHNYMYYGKLSPEMATYRETFGWWVWRSEVINEP